MATVIVIRCRRDECQRRILVTERGDVEPIGGARIIGTDRDGNSTFVCTCGQILVWDRDRHGTADPVQ